jgi:hypothetical protein
MPVLQQFVLSGEQYFGLQHWLPQNIAPDAQQYPSFVLHTCSDGQSVSDVQTVEQIPST